MDIEVKNSRAYGLKIPQTAITEKEAYKIPLDFLTTGGDSADEGFYRKRRREASLPLNLFRRTSSGKRRTRTERASATWIWKPSRAETPCCFPIPTSASRWAETETLKGAYNINRGYAVFKYVDILDENSEYCIVRKTWPTASGPTTISF